MNKRVFETTLAGLPLKVEIGEVAKQAGGSLLTRYGDTVVLTAVVRGKRPTHMDFFPLQINYQEKLYAAGKIPGGFLRREGRPSENEILISRLIDRPIRPLFPEGFNYEVQVLNTVLSSDPEAPSDIAALIGSSIGLLISDIPFNGPVAGVTLGYINDEFVVNPSEELLLDSHLKLTIAGTSDAINMVEAEGLEVSEDLMLEALEKAHEIVKDLNAFQETIVNDFKVEKMVFELPTIDEATKQHVLSLAEDKIVKAMRISEKQARNDAIQAARDEVIDYYQTKGYFIDVDGIKVLDIETRDAVVKQVKTLLDSIVTKELRRLITVEKIRPDGRKPDEIRNLTSVIDLLPRAHGSSLFTRGQTQALAVVTLGSLGQNQIIDGLGEEETKRFMLHYNFPAYSVGETGRYFGPGRREIGHGALGEKALLQVLPDEDSFPYSVRVVSEILESNGSSSMATICAGSMALMQAGVPIKSSVAGIAMGLIMEGKDYTILTDIQGQEDHEGDMDFKVAGTKDGITALQMDIKISGITFEILKEALAQARKARLQLLDHMNTIINNPTEEVSKYAPKVKVIKIDPDKIRDVIGSGGKIITQIIEDHDNVKIDIEQDGRVFIMHSETKWINATAKYIENLVRVPELGQIYEVKAVKMLMDRTGQKSQGVFVQLWPGTEGLIHISNLDKKRVEKVEDVVNIGDIILAKVIKIDERGRINLSRADAL